MTQRHAMPPCLCLIMSLSLPFGIQEHLPTLKELTRSRFRPLLCNVQAGWGALGGVIAQYRTVLTAAAMTPWIDRVRFERDCCPMFNVRTANLARASLHRMWSSHTSNLPWIEWERTAIDGLSVLAAVNLECALARLVLAALLCLTSCFRFRKTQTHV